LYLSFGYLIGNSSLFRNVDRVPGGQRIEINSRVKTAEYADIQAFESALNFSASDFRCVVDACASSIRNRVAVQFDHSENPVLLLTGGRDSRCIGAALSKEKKDIEAWTGGGANSRDAREAARVAQVLGFKHSCENVGKELFDRLVSLATSYERGVFWSRVYEGVETIRQGIVSPFFPRNGDVGRSQQRFHGDGGALLKSEPVYKGGGSIREIKGRIRELIPAGLKQLRIVSETVDELFTGADLATDTVNGTKDTWLTVFYWKHRLGQWSSDALTVKRTKNWLWTPLVDKVLLQAGLFAPAGFKEKYRLINGVTIRNAPVLGKLIDEIENPGYVDGFKRIVGSRLRYHAWGPFNRQIGRSNWSKYWDGILLSKANVGWKEVVDEKYVRQMIESDPTSEVLWNLATMELFLSAFFK
jgi:hypothetical protein